MPQQTWKSFNTIFRPQWKDVKNSYAVRLESRCVKDFGVTKIVKQVKLDENWGNLEANASLEKKSWAKYHVFC